MSRGGRGEGGAEVIALSASIAVKPPWIVPADVESHLLQGRATTPPLADLHRAEAGEVMDRRARQLVVDQRPHHLEPAAALELLLRENLALQRGASADRPATLPGGWRLS